MKKMKFEFKLEYLVLLFLLSFPFILISSIKNANNEAQIRQEQILHVANVTEETTFTTKDQKEANQLIKEIQKNDKEIVKIDVFKSDKSTVHPTIKITYK